MLVTYQYYSVQAFARRLQVEADRLGKLLDQRTKTQLKEQEQNSITDESSDAIWNELSEALIRVREEMADAGISHEEAEGRAASILKGLGFRYPAVKWDLLSLPL